MHEPGQFGVNLITLTQQRRGPCETIRVHSRKCPTGQRAAHSHAAGRSSAGAWCETWLRSGGQPVAVNSPNADFHKANRPPVWGHTRWQWGRGGSAERGDRTPSRPSPVITAAPVLTFFSTNYMGTGCVVTCRRVRWMAASSARRMRSQRDIPQLHGGPTQSACTTTLREDPQQRFPQSVGVGSWPRKSALRAVPYMISSRRLGPAVPHRHAHCSRQALPQASRGKPGWPA